MKNESEIWLKELNKKILKIIKINSLQKEKKI